MIRKAPLYRYSRLLLGVSIAMIAACVCRGLVSATATVAAKEPNQLASNNAPAGEIVDGASGKPKSATSPVNKVLMREGERIINQLGEFKLTGEAATFHPKEGEPVRVLENLALERVVKILSETRGRREWLVTGVVTEYRGSNYLLIQRSVLKARQAEKSSG